MSVRTPGNVIDALPTPSQDAGEYRDREGDLWFPVLDRRNNEWRWAFVASRGPEIAVYDPGPEFAPYVPVALLLSEDAA